jgi:hypothetical protein
MTRRQPAGQRSYDESTKDEALRLAEEVGTAEAGRRLGIPPGTIRSWRHHTGKVTQAPSGADPDEWQQVKRQAAEHSFGTAMKALRRCNELLEMGRMADAQKTALSMAILVDKSGVLEMAARQLDDRQAALSEQQARQVVDLIGAVLDDLGVPIGQAARRVFAAHVRGDTDAAAAERARREITEQIGTRYVADHPELVERRREPLALPAPRPPHPTLSTTSTRSTTRWRTRS